MDTVYVAYHKNPNEVEKCSSGAIFTALSEVVLQQGGKTSGGTIYVDLTQ